MKVAIPLFVNRISPRFDFAPTLGLFDIEGEKVVETKEISCKGLTDLERVLRLKDLGVKTLICGGLPNYLLGLLNHHGIEVIPWVAGDANEALALYLQGKLSPRMALCPGRWSRQRFCKKRGKQYNGY